jgi:hypothetical protein
MSRCTGLLLRYGALLFLLATSAALPAAELMLRDEKLAQTAEGREQLKYLVNCALPADATVVAVADNQRFSFPGGMGLAPGWATKPLTAAEQRRVSACMLARTNRFGVPVQLSIRSDAADAPTSLHADADERREFSFFEAGFFGNLFLEQPEGYVCTGDTPSQRMPHLRSLLRVCSLPMTGTETASGISRCGFVMVGACKGRPFVQNGTDYSSDVLNVYLPGPR